MRFLFILYSFLALDALAQTGVGTTNPVNKLHLVGDTASPLKTGTNQNSLLRLSNSVSDLSLDFGISKDNYSWVQSRNSGNYSLSNSLILNPNGGNVGINTLAPTEKLEVSGSVLASGAIRSTTAGQLLHSVFLNESDLNVTNNITNSSTTETTVATYSYTPVSSSSKIYIEFDARCGISGGVSDEFASYIVVGSTKIQSNATLFNSGQGGGGRGNALFPILGYYTNSSTNALTISITMHRVTSDDTITVLPDMSLIIQEVAR